jgi:hypothetical protein
MPYNDRNACNVHAGKMAPTTGTASTIIIIPYNMLNMLILTLYVNADKDMLLTHVNADKSMLQH